MDYPVIELGISTVLYQNNPCDDTVIHSVIHQSIANPGTSDAQISEEFPFCHIDSKDIRIQPILLINKQLNDIKQRSHLVKGSDIKDVPTQYEVHGLNHDELPVIGTFVHSKVTPGFKYTVRLLGQDKYLFNRKSFYLLSIGRGYGKRITFEGESQNTNSNYFYSDTNMEGYGFCIKALDEGQHFIVCSDEGYAMGQGTVQETSMQKEASCIAEKDGTIVKQVIVQFTCDVQYGTSKHGLKPLCVVETMQLSGMALVVKPKGCSRAVTKSVQQIVLPNYGPCELYFSQ